MSVTVAKTHGVTVFTLTSDPNNPWPPLCQIFKGLCYSSMCCTVSQQLKKVQRTSQSVLGTLHIMDGLLNIGLGAILICSGAGASYDMRTSLFPFWFGGLVAVTYIFWLPCRSHEEVIRKCVYPNRYLSDLVDISMSMCVQPQLV